MNPYRYAPQVHVEEIHGSLWSKIKGWFWRQLWCLTKNPNYQFKMAESLLKGLPASAFFCVDCNQEDCCCPE